MKNRQIIIVGTGRSGSGYLSKLLTLNGIMCGHEHSFNPSRHGPIQHPYQADSSWLAVPYLDNYIHNTKILHVVRDPIKVLESLTTRGFFKTKIYRKVNDPGDKFYKFVEKFLPEINTIECPVHTAIYFIIHWSKMIEKAIGTQYYQLETDLPLLLDKLGITNPKYYSDTKYNTNTSKSNKIKLDLKSLDNTYLKMLTLHRKNYGYKI
jgi:LPS sulfotransferase NodH